MGGVLGRGKERGNIIVQKRMMCSGIYSKVIIHRVQYFYTCFPCKRKIMKVFYILLLLSKNIDLDNLKLYIK